MKNKKALRIATAALLAGVTVGAAQAASAAHPGRSTGASGTITITDWQFPDGCNAIATASVADQEICQPAEDSLFLLDNKLGYQPDLALNIPTTANGEVKIVGGNSVVSYKFKPNLKFSDGSPITANDFVFSVKVELAEGNAFGLDQITNMKVVSPQQVDVTYKGTYGPYVAYGNPQPLVSQHYFETKYGTTDIAKIATANATDKYNSPNDVFPGAYKIGSYTSGQSMVMVPNPYYTALPAAAGHARPAQIKFVSIAGDAPGLIAALQSPNSGVDKAEDFQPSDLPGLNKATTFKVKLQPALFVEHLELNQGGVLKDVRLRQALQFAIDKVALYKTLFPAVTNPSDFVLRTILPNSSPFLDKSVGISQYNPAKAKALLAAAGYGPGHPLTIRFVTTPSQVRKNDFAFLKRQWEAVGINAIATFPSGSPAANGGLFSPYSLNGVLTQRRFDVALFAFSESADPQQQEDNFNPAYVPTTAVHGGADQNYAGVTDKDQYALLEKARTSIDAGQRRALFNQWQQLTNQRVYFIMLYNRSNITLDNGAIGNYSLNPSNAGNSWNAYQWFRAS